MILEQPDASSLATPTHANTADNGLGDRRMHCAGLWTGARTSSLKPFSKLASPTLILVRALSAIVAAGDGALRDADSQAQPRMPFCVRLAKTFAHCGRLLGTFVSLPWPSPKPFQALLRPPMRTGTGRKRSQRAAFWSASARRHQGELRSISSVASCSKWPPRSRRCVVSLRSDSPPITSH